MANHATPSPDATPSPAQILRRAAFRLRTNWPDCDCHAFERAVADLLDDEAQLCEETGDRPYDYAVAVARAYLGESA